MSRDLYWKVKQPAKKLLPTSFKWAIQKAGLSEDVPDVEFVRGFLAGMQEDTTEQMQVQELLKAMEDGQDIELEWR